MCYVGSIEVAYHNYVYHLDSYILGPQLDYSQPEVLRTTLGVQILAT